MGAPFFFLIDFYEGRNNLFETSPSRYNLQLTGQPVLEKVTSKRSGDTMIGRHWLDLSPETLYCFRFEQNGAL